MGYKNSDFMIDQSNKDNSRRKKETSIVAYELVSYGITIDFQCMS
jgi:hypothetical protein